MLTRLRDQHGYDGIQTCAGAGSCAIPGPIGLDTGAIVKQPRQKEHGSRPEEVALTTVRNWARGRKFARASLVATGFGSKVAGLGLVKSVAAVARGAGLDAGRTRTSHESCHAW
jgi:D-lactate dehydrogenase